MKMGVVVGMVWIIEECKVGFDGFRGVFREVVVNGFKSKEINIVIISEFYIIIVSVVCCWR